MVSREDLAHLLRRAGFGPRSDEVDAAERVGPAATLDALLAPAGADAGGARTPPPAPPDPVAALPRNAPRDQRQAAQKQQREQVMALTVWWLDRMVAAEH